MKMKKSTAFVLSLTAICVMAAGAAFTASAEEITLDVMMAQYE